MISFHGLAVKSHPSPPWTDDAPVREELFSVERLEQHAASLALAQTITQRPPTVLSLRKRLDANAAILLAAYRASAAELESGRSVVPAAEWFLDNYHLIESQIREIREDLPPGYYRQLPKLAEGPFAGYPRVFGMTWAFVAHTDSHFDPDILRRFVAAYQQVQPLTIGELWAIAITFRIVLVENLRRLADQITKRRGARATADALADQMLGAGAGQTVFDADMFKVSSEPLFEPFAAQLAKRLRDRDPQTTPALGWLEERLAQQDSSIDDVVQRAQQRQGASNVTVRNVITSLRLISDIDWADLFESMSLVDARLSASSDFASMDFATRNLYRNAIEQLARGSALSELDIADQALDAAKAAKSATVDPIEADRVGDPGYHLIAGGRRAFEQTIRFRPGARLWLWRFATRQGIGGYVGAIALVTLLALAISIWAMASTGLAVWWLVLFFLLACVPASEVATALVHRAVAETSGATALPGLALKAGVPPTLRTLIAVPAILTGEAELVQQIEQLEIHYLASASGDLIFALLLDGADAHREILDSDAQLLATANRAIAQLNARYGPVAGGDRFLLLYRRRIFNAGENKWIGWERKRGKLHELNRLLRGATDTTFMPNPDRAPVMPADVRYVITLDADTKLPRDAALRLIGKMAHPLNRPSFSAIEQRVVDGYAILQPRVTPSLPFQGQGSFYQWAFSGPSGMDPYAAAVSDVYQDLFGEGTFTGKGIYDIDAVEAALAGRVPENSLLSHDLFEGIFARAGLASDVEVVEDFPSRYDVAVKRQHRWTRGDWQLLPWVFAPKTGHQSIPAIGRWKMLDNLRRSLLAPFTFLALILCWLLPIRAGVTGALLVLAAMALPAFLPMVFSAIPRRTGISLGRHMGTLATDLRLAAIQSMLSLVFLADKSWQMGDAVARTLVRLFWSRRHLLEWTTAAQSSAQPRPDLVGFYREMAGGTALGLIASAAAVMHMPSSWPIIAPFSLLWALAPAMAYWTSRSTTAGSEHSLSAPDTRELRLIARQTWRFFEAFVTPADNMLPPDNFQEDPKPAVAHRTSPTNIGLYLLSSVAARDFGWAGTIETIERLETTFASMRKLPRFKGHFFNWYDTQDLRVLDPAYVSSVDSGNLAGHLIALANACEEWMDDRAAPDIRLGLFDNLQLARQSIARFPNKHDGQALRLVSILDKIEAELTGARANETPLSALELLTGQAAELAQDLVREEQFKHPFDLMFWIDALNKGAREHGRDARGEATVRDRLSVLASTARDFAMAMDFAFLLDPERNLLSIGYSQTDNSLDPSCYDLLASEARLASLFAIAKGDVPTKHWFRLGRAATQIGMGSALLSWSGSMFEYLMPSLVMRAPTGSLLEQTSRLVVERQKAYARAVGIPWGISESAFNARDLEFTYQYSNFGVPGLGLKRGLAENLVIAPYASGLAAMVDPGAARRNYLELAGLGARGRYGFYDALDFTRSRLPENENVAIVRNFMAHHQGMTIVSIANTLHDGQMRARFHREPIIRASELLLQERMPREVVATHPLAEEVKASASEPGIAPPTVRRLKPSAAGTPKTHLLSNGRYSVMVTATGAGYSRWRDMAVTRWREDATCDAWGSFIFLRDVASGKIWSAGDQPIRSEADYDEVVFSEDHAEFMRRDGTLATVVDIVVSGEDDGEVRRVSLTNSGRRPREIELTSYAELVLTSPASDNAHPAFAKMFVQTEYLPEFGALIATRRPRSPADPEVWAAHFAVVEGGNVATLQYESDRARFIGRSRTLADCAAVMDGKPLSNTVGTVLDPIFSLRHRLTIPAGKVARVAYWTMVASSRAALIDLIDKHDERSAFDRAKTLAWTQAQVQLRHLDVEAEDAADFQRLAAPIVYADPRFRVPSESIIRGAGPQSRLWPYAISGDLPIVLVRIDDAEDIELVRQLLRAQEYWRMKRLDVDLVIINRRASSYVQDLQIAIEAAVRSTQSRPRFGDEQSHGAVYTLRADLINAEAFALLQSVARVVLNARDGSIADQLARLPLSPLWPAASPRPARLLPPSRPAPASPELEFFNGFGGFDKNGTEYVTILAANQTTPAPWINVIANPGFGFQVSAEGSGYTWADNSRENQLTQWSNDPVSDPTGEAIYVRDEDTGTLCTASAQPIRDAGSYTSRHGFGYSRFEHEANGIAMDLLQYVPLADPIKISRLTLKNLSGKPRRLSVTGYTEWVLGTSRGASGPFISTEIDRNTGAMFARNPWSAAFPGRVAFADLGGRQTDWTANRSEFLGRQGSMAAPAALTGEVALSRAIGAGLDPCSALQCFVELAAGETIEIVSFIGQSSSAQDASALIERYRAADLDAVLAEVTAHWQSLLGSVQVKTPDRAMDVMLNGWLLYQTLACRVWARSAFYQASGAYGFRDQLQDGMALTFARPEETRAHLLRAASRQFVEGDVQHWWLPHSGQGVRTRISDDRVWLAFAAATYIACADDVAVLDEMVPFLEGPVLRPGEHDAFFQPMVADETATLYDHCARGLDQCLQLTGDHGLPLMGTGDWNDGMSRVGEGGKGESVWLGWLLVRTIDLFAPLAKDRDAARARRWRAHAVSVRKALEREAWDGEWYRRATYDDGTWLGSKQSDECRIDSIAQSWAVLSGGADPARAATAMASVEKYLIRPGDGLALLFTPPFDQTAHDPGYIKGYPPGLRENGGQYSHAAMWAIMAFAELGEAEKAASLFALLNPINHGRTPEQVNRYKVEPYVIAADVYSVAPYVGRGGWTWYTGSAGWMYRAGVEAILGIRREGQVLVLNPCIPPEWPGFEARIALGSTRYDITVAGRGGGKWNATIDGLPMTSGGAGVRVPLDGAVHDLRLTRE